MTNCSKCGKKIGFFSIFSSRGCNYSGCKINTCPDCSEFLIKECPDCEEDFCQNHMSNHGCEMKEKTEEDEEEEMEDDDDEEEIIKYYGSNKEYVMVDYDKHDNWDDFFKDLKKLEDEGYVVIVCLSDYKMFVLRKGQ